MFVFRSRLMKEHCVNLLDPTKNIWYLAGDLSNPDEDVKDYR
jgi:hypothetical protein